MTTLKAQIKTKSNYKNLNGKFVKVIQFLGTIVYCEYINEDGDVVRCDFSINEITEIREANS
jgi:hypothetical protein